MSFFEQILRHHDRRKFEVFLYSNVQHPDSTTQRIASLADHWKDIAALDDDAACEMIRQDRIDILIDLAGHTARHRLLVFARRPAPIQITYLGYPNTTGMRSIDYRITDGVTDPPGLTESHYTETLIRLPGCFLCYQPPPEVADLPPRPARQSNAPVTFGSFNTFAKISAQTFDLWSAVLSAVPNSQLLLKAESLADPLLQQSVRGEFSGRGIHHDRIELIGWTSTLRGHFESYHQVDFALDTFPYNGTTTTCEALWMGVPVITLCGNSHVSRVGASLLQAVGMDHLVCRSQHGFTAVARSLGQFPSGIEETSGHALRNSMSTSRLFDAATFVLIYESRLQAALRANGT